MENIYKELCERAYKQIVPTFKSPYDCQKLGEKILADLDERPWIVKDIVEAEQNEIEQIMKNDLKTYEHCRAVAEIAKDVAYSLNLAENEIEFVYQSGLVHDIGKLFNGKYNNSVQMNGLEKAEHVIIGDILARARELLDRPFPRYLKNAISYHHDRPGNGEKSYPHRNPIVLLPTAIVQVADTWHAMAERGGYQRKFSNNEIAEHLIEGTKNGLYMIEAVKALVRK